MNDIKYVTGKGPINIALIKYWGKEDEENIIPLNNSISLTLDMNEFYTEIRGELHLEIQNRQNKLILNEKEEKINNRVQKLIDFVRENCNENYYCSKDIISNSNLIIVSRNTFPTAAGCASSASSMSCLVKVLCKLFNLNLNDTYQSHLARQASGSACRSIYGGIVEWEKYNDTSKLSVANQLVDFDYWDLRIILLIVNDKKKDIGSTEGMKLSKETSSFLKYRVNEILPERIKQFKQTIVEKNFEKLCEITMKDSNNFHAVCRDTYPSINYLNDTSCLIIKIVELINQKFERNICGYTFDAGPNAFIIVEPENIKVVKNYFESIFNMAYDNSHDDIINHFKEECIKLNAKVDKIVEFKMGQGAYII